MRVIAPVPLLLASLVASLVASGCSRGDQPDAFVKAGLEAVGGKPRALWDALPPSYQKDTGAVLTAFAAKVPEKPWNDGFALAGKVVKVLETKKTFVLGHPALAGAPIKPEDLSKGWDPAVHLLGTLVNSEIKTVQGLRSLDVGKFLDGTASTVVSDATKLADTMGPALPAQGATKLAELRAKLKDVKVTTENVTETTADVKVEVPGEAPETEAMVKIDGKWVPKQLADRWGMMVLGAQAAIGGIEIDPAMIAQFDALKAAVEPAIDGLLAADSQEAFNAQVDALMKGAMGAAQPSRPLAEADAVAPSDQADAEAAAMAAAAAAPVAAKKLTKAEKARAARAAKAKKRAAREE